MGETFPKTGLKIPENKSSSFLPAIKSKKLIIFDYDGVIVDSFPSQYEIYKIICDKFGKKIQPTIGEFSKAFWGGYMNYRKEMGIISPEDNLVVDKIYGEEVLKHKPPLFAGIPEVLKKIEKKYIVAMVSANYKGNVLAKLTYYQIHHHFHHLIGLDENSPNPMNKSVEIKALLLKLKVNPNDVVMIGDRNVDYIEAKKAGIDKIILTNYGWGFDKEKTPDRVPVEVNEPKDILKALRKIDFC